MTVNDRYFIELVSSAIRQRTPTPPPAGVDWEYIYRRAVAHQVANTVYYGILKLQETEQPPADVFGKFQEQTCLILAQETMQQEEANRLFEVLEERGIAFCPLKGWQMKELYPRSEMRSMSDVDVLIRKEDVDKMPGIMEGLGYSRLGLTDNADVYRKGMCVSIELHSEMVVNPADWREYYKTIWTRITPKSEGSKICEMSKEDFYVYLIVHLVRHYLLSGTGMRSVADVWVYKEYYKEQLDKQYLEKQWKALGLDKFIKHIEYLADIWLGEAESSPLYEEMTDYILSCGVYGKNENFIVMKHVLNGNESVTGQKIKYLIQRVFLKREEMENYFPVLQRYPLLLPGCWMIRLFNSLFRRKERAIAELKNLRSLKQEDIRKIEMLHRNTGLL